MTSRQEQAIDDYLRSIGLDPQPNPAEPAGEGDRLIGGARAEYKTLSGVRNPTPDALSKAIANRAMNARSQATHVIIDTRGQPGLNAEIADRGLRRAFGADNAVASMWGEPPRIASIRVIIRQSAGNDADRFAARDERAP